MSWNRFNSLIYFLPKDVPFFDKIFDLDETCISRPNCLDPKIVDKDPDNWTFLGPIPEKFQKSYIFKDYFQ